METVDTHYGSGTFDNEVTVCVCSFVYACTVQNFQKLDKDALHNELDAFVTYNI